MCIPALSTPCCPFTCALHGAVVPTVPVDVNYPQLRVIAKAGDAAVLHARCAALLGKSTAASEGAVEELNDAVAAATTGSAVGGK